MHSRGFCNCSRASASPRVESLRVSTWTPGGTPWGSHFAVPLAAAHEAALPAVRCVARRRFVHGSPTATASSVISETCSEGLPALCALFPLKKQLYKSPASKTELLPAMSSGENNSCQTAHWKPRGTLTCCERKLPQLMTNTSVPALSSSSFTSTLCFL